MIKKQIEKLKFHKLEILLTLFVVFLMIIINAQNINAQEEPGTYIDSGANCNSNGHKIIMYLSNSTNSHGSLKNGQGFPTNLVLCANFGSGNTDCSSEKDPDNENQSKNKILGLSSQSNAHAERPDTTNPNYNTHNVCYDSVISCSKVDGENCNSINNEYEIIRIFSDNNSHLEVGQVGNVYSQKICCVVVKSPGQCDLTSAKWEVTQVANGTKVNMNVTGNDECKGKTINFEVFRGGTSCTNINGCTQPSDVTFPENRNYVIGEWTAAPPGENYTFVAKVSDTQESITSSNNLTVLLTPSFCQEQQITLCSQYKNQNHCNNNVCLVNPQGQIRDNVDCSDPNIDCGCKWDSDEKCKVNWLYTNSSTGQNVGSCTYTQETNDDCSDGLLIVNLTARWVWNSSCDDNCKSQYQYLQNQCTSGLKSVECPAQIALPFFGFYQFVIAVLVIAAIYFVIIIRRNHSKKRS